MSGFLDDWPEDAEVARERLYGGAIYRLPATTSTLAVVGEVLSAAALDLNATPSWPAIEAARAALGADRVRAACAALVRAYGELEPILIDRPRLRVVTPDGHRIDAAAPAYYAHRDTWYANPLCQINWWLALHDTDGGSFAIYPAAFDVAVANDSRAFDYDEFVRLAGWQNRDRDPRAVYPRALRSWPRGGALAVEARRGELIVFSGAHLHQTRPNTGAVPRFSVDFRTVHRDDLAAGKGARNVDTAARGDASSDYERLG